MNITSDQVLKKLKDIISMHLKTDPVIGVDSLALGLNISPHELMPLLMQLKQEELIILHRNSSSSGRSNGRLDDYTGITLR